MRPRRTFCVALLLSIAALPLHAALLRGKLLQNAHGQRVPAGGVSVTVLNGNRQRSFAVKTDAGGFFSFPNVVAGGYTLEIWQNPSGPPIPYKVQVTEPLTDVPPLNLP